uniref:Uncharacterized protein n=1 Tax=Glossina palpalis gambiensis TaxID=67801 RepID=A0A1B0AU60_9MUSC
KIFRNRLKQKERKPRKLIEERGERKKKKTKQFRRHLVDFLHRHINGLVTACDNALGRLGFISF